MMLPTDLALVEDAALKKHVVTYAKDEAAFTADFAGAFSKLLHLGVPSSPTSWTPLVVIGSLLAMGSK